jgi:hypothetical protein
LHALVVGKVDALWMHSDDSTASVKAAGKEGLATDKKSGKKSGKKSK